MHCILHIIATNFFGGPEKQIVKHCASVDSQQWRMIICSFLEGKPENVLLKQGAELGLETAILNTANAYNPLFLWELANLIRHERPDVIVAHGYRPLILCLLLKPYHNKPIIAYSRGYTAENLKVRVFENLHRIFLRFSDLILAVSEGHRRILIDYGLAAHKIQVVHNAVSVAPPADRQEADLRKIIFQRLSVPQGTMVVTAGRLSPEKGHRFLLEAISILGNKVNNTYFIICGEGACQEKLERQAQELKVADRCRFVGFRRDIDDIFRVMDFMVLPSLTEGLPNVVLEAFANKKPVVATAVGGVPEIVQDGVSGILVPPSRSDLLAKGIERVLGSRDFRENLGRAGYYKVKTDFSFEKQTKKLEDIYQFILN